MNKISRDFQPLLSQFRADDPHIGLEKIKFLVEEGQKTDIFHHLRFIVLLPGPLVISFGVRNIIRSQKNIDSFRNLFQQEPILIIFATIFYFTMWWHLLPILVSCWNLFSQIYSWQEFFISLFEWSTFQFIILFCLNFLISLLALKSFKLTPTFEDRYQSLKSLALARYQNPIERANVNNQIIRNAPQMMQNLIDQTFTAMLANGELDSETANKVINIMQHCYGEIMSNCNFEDSINIGEVYLENEDFRALKEKQ